MFHFLLILVEASGRPTLSSQDPIRNIPLPGKLILIIGRGFIAVKAEKVSFKEKLFLYFLFSVEFYL